MNRIRVRSIPASLRLYSIPSGRLGTMTCPECRGMLDILQPNTSKPEQFLGTCEDCGAWFRVESRPDDERDSFLRVPAVAELDPPAPHA